MSGKNKRPSENAQGSAPQSAPDEITKGLLARLGHLRATTKEICGALAANIERDILELVELINVGKRAKKGSWKIRPADLEKAEALLGKLSVKPEKGRRGDLKRIEKALEDLMGLLGRGESR